MGDLKTFLDLYKRQRSFTEKVIVDQGRDPDNLSLSEEVNLLRTNVLALNREAYELLDLFPWKVHRRTKRRRPDLSEILEEYVDVLKYLLGIGVILNLTPDKILEEFERKSQVVEYRFEMERRLQVVDSNRVVAVDIDGVLNDYPADFVRWVVARCPETRRPEFTTSIDLKLEDIRRILGPREIARLKEIYRASGAKRDQVVRPGAKEFLDRIRALGYTVVLISRRPYWRYSRIYADTLEWLRLNDLRFDALLFHPEKHRKILEDFPNLVLLIDDDVVVAREVEVLGYRVAVLRSSRDNEGYDEVLEVLEGIEGGER